MVFVYRCVAEYQTHLVWAIGRELNLRLGGVDARNSA